jgi:hypothetical protein
MYYFKISNLRFKKNFLFEILFKYSSSRIVLEMTSKVFAGHSFRNDLIEAKVFAAVKRFMTNSPTPRYVLRYERVP